MPFYIRLCLRVGVPYALHHPVFMLIHCVGVLNRIEKQYDLTFEYEHRVIFIFVPYICFCIATIDICDVNVIPLPGKPTATSLIPITATVTITATSTALCTSIQYIKSRISALRLCVCVRPCQ